MILARNNTTERKAQPLTAHQRPHEVWSCTLGEAESLFAHAMRLDKQLLAARLNLAYLYLLKGAPEKTIAGSQEAMKFRR
jgi:hypothetical protein